MLTLIKKDTTSRTFYLVSTLFQIKEAIPPEEDIGRHLF